MILLKCVAMDLMPAGGAGLLMMMTGLLVLTMEGMMNYVLL